MKSVPRCCGWAEKRLNCIRKVILRLKLQQLELYRRGITLWWWMRPEMRELPLIPGRIGNREPLQHFTKNRIRDMRLPTIKKQDVS